MLPSLSEKNRARKPSLAFVSVPGRKLFAAQINFEVAFSRFNFRAMLCVTVVPYSERPGIRVLLVTDEPRIAGSENQLEAHLDPKGSAGQSTSR